MRTSALIVAIALSAVALAGQAAATTRYVVFRGTIDGGVDNVGVFGAPGDLAGRSYAVVYGYDPALGFNGLSPDTEDLRAGALLGRSEPDPIVSLTVRVGSQTFDAYLQPARLGSVSTFNAYQTLGYAGVNANFNSGGLSGPYVNVNNVVYTTSAPTRLNVDYAGYSAGYYPGGPPGIFEYYDGLGGANAIFTMRPERVYLTSDLAAAIPEPCAWLMMIGGFAAAGAVCRGRRRTQRRLSFPTPDSR